MPKTFTEYLQDIHGEIFWSLLDDEGPDHFDNWLGDLDGEQYIKYADLYGREMFIDGKLKSTEEALELIKK